MRVASRKDQALAVFGLGTSGIATGLALINGGAILDYRTKDGSTCLHRAVVKGRGRRRNWDDVSRRTTSGEIVMTFRDKNCNDVSRQTTSCGEILTTTFLSAIISHSSCFLYHICLRRCS